MKTNKLFFQFLFVVLLAGFIFTPNISWGDPPIMIHFTAEVAEVHDFSNLLEGAIMVGDEIRGIYSYNAATPDSNTLDTSVGDYWHHTPPYGIRVFAGSYIFTTDPRNVQFLVEINNDHYTGYDNYLLRSYNNLPARGLFVEHISWQLDDDSMTALNSDALPSVPPVLDDWASFGLMIQGCLEPERGGSCSFDRYLFIIKAHVNSVNIYP